MGNTKISIGVIFTMDLSLLIDASHSRRLQFNWQASFSNVYWDFKRPYSLFIPKIYLCPLIYCTKSQLANMLYHFIRSKLKVNFSFLSPHPHHHYRFLFISLSLCAFVCLIPSAKDFIFILLCIFFFPNVFLFLHRCLSKIICLLCCAHLAVLSRHLFKYFLPFCNYLITIS